MDINVSTENVDIITKVTYIHFHKVKLALVIINHDDAYWEVLELDKDNKVNNPWEIDITDSKEDTIHKIWCKYNEYLDGITHESLFNIIK